MEARPDRTPVKRSITLSDIEARQLRDRLLDEQTHAGAVTGGLLGAAAAVAIYLAIISMPYLFVIALLLPGAVAGYVVKRTGKAFEMHYRVLAGAFVFAGLLGADLVLAGSWLAPLIALPNAVIAIAISRRKLSMEEEYAIYRHRMGLE